MPISAINPSSHQLISRRKLELSTEVRRTSSSIIRVGCRQGILINYKLLTAMLHFLTISPSLWSINIILSLKMRLKGIIRSRRCCRPTARVVILRSSAKSIKSCTIMGTFQTRDPICTDKSHWSFRTISSVIVWIRLDRLRIPEMILEISKILLMLTEARCFRVIKWWAGWMGHWDLSPPAREQVIDPEIMDWFLWTLLETCLQVLETRSKVRNQINYITRTML